MKEIEGQLKLSESKCSDFKDDIDRLRREVQKADSLESELRKSVEQHSRDSVEIQNLKDQVGCSSEYCGNENTEFSSPERKTS